jgi:hypothetical protein
MKKLLLVICIFLICGCKAHYRDVSLEPRFSEIVGKTLITREKMRLNGIQGVGSDSSVPDSYVLTGLPGFWGHYVLTTKYLPPGTMLKVDKVRQCINCLGVKLLDFQVRIEKWDLTRDVFLTDMGEKIVTEFHFGKQIPNRELFDVLAHDPD